MREQLLETTDIALVHEAAAAGAQVAFALAVLVAEIVAAAGRVGFEALRRLAETLGRSPVGFQLGHDRSPLLMAPVTGAPTHSATGERRSPTESGVPRRYFFFGAKTMIICLPSIIGFCSMTPYVARSADTRARSLRPMSWCTISRPRNRRVTLALSPSVRKRIRLRSFTW